MTIVKNIMDFILNLGIYLFCVMGFYLSTNNYYFIGGKMVDFSLLGWGLMLGVWVWGIVNYLRQKDFKLVIFASQLAVICFAFDCWRLYAFAANLTMKSYIVVVLFTEVVCVLWGWWRKNKVLLQSALISFLIVFAGGVIAYPVLLAWNQMLVISSLWALFGLLNLLPFVKPRYLLSGVCITVLTLGAYFYVNSFGIHFYEPKITKPAENVKVSIVVPIYNAEKTLERCLDSLRKQTLKDIEIICVNDGSTDKSGKILAKYADHDARFKIITQENKYIGAARDAGIAAATGEYVGFVDSDDWVSLDYFEDMYQTGKKYNTDIVMTGNVMEVHDSKAFRRQAPNIDRYVLSKKIIVQPLDNVGWLRRFVWDKIYRRDFLEKYKIKSTYRRAIYEDFYFYIQTILPQSPISIASHATYYYFMDNLSVTRAKKYAIDEASLAMFVDIDNMLRDYPMTMQLREKWQKFIQEVRIYCLVDFVDALGPEQLEIWKKMCHETFPQDEFNFDNPKQNLLLF